MFTASKILRTIALAMMSCGGAAITFAAIVLVKAATAKGIPVAEAAQANSPVFIAFAKVLLGCTVLAALGEGGDFLFNKNKGKLAAARYVLTLIAIGTALAFSLGITPQMEALLPTLNTSSVDHDAFTKLHEISRVVFGVTIFSALVSLILPLFEKPSVTRVADAGERKVTVSSK